MTVADTENPVSRAEDAMRAGESPPQVEIGFGGLANATQGSSQREWRDERGHLRMDAVQFIFGGKRDEIVAFASKNLPVLS